MKLPEAQVQNTRNAEEQLVQRLDEYRKINTDETTVLNYFDELEINPITLALETAEAGAFDLVLKTIGRTRNYGASAETVAAEKAAIEKKRVSFS